MAELRARRTLLKSLPELWTECSQAKSLARHLGEFGEIRITKLQPESTVAWEGDAVSGTVRLESSGWGTRVTLTVSDTRGVRGAEPDAAVGRAAEPEPESADEPDPVAESADEPDPVAESADEPKPVAAAPVDLAAPAEAAPARPPGFWARVFGGLRRARAPEPEPRAVTESETATEPATAAAHERPAEPESGTQPVAGPGAPTPPAERTLDAALESLGRAHHRPYSRS
jgi:hypothetical protein